MAPGQESSRNANSDNDEAWSDAARRGLTMFCDQMAAAIDGARTLTRLDHLSRSIWQSLAAGAVADDDAQALAEQLHARRALIRGDLKLVGLPPGRPSIFPPRRLQRAPQRPVAITRRR